MRSIFNSHRGQALLIVVLVMVVVLTVGLSVASRSIVNLRITSEEQQSQRAFSAAEAGIELALRTNESITQAVDLKNNAEIKEVTFTNPSGSSFLLNGGNNVIKEEGIDAWLVAHNDNGTINYSNPPDPNFFTIYWGNSADGCSNAAIEVIVIAGTSASSATAKRYAYDPCSTRRGNNNFAAPESAANKQKTVEGRTFFYNTHIADNDRIDIRDGLVVRIIPLYANTPMALFMCNPGQGQEDQNCTPLPSQGKQIESIGKSGDATRKVTLFQGYPSLPVEFFANVLFCAGGSGSCVMQ